MDRRALFFIAAAVLCATLMFVVEADLVWVPRTVAIVYVVLAVASWLDWRTNQ
ncbi:MAG: hypothetical protein ACRDZ7_21110 [Acidimicrobiia bacterium]